MFPHREAATRVERENARQDTMEGTLPVTLIVKAPNQQIEDQTIKCELSWTINKLKQHLQEVYPSRPVSPSSREKVRSWESAFLGCVD